MERGERACGEHRLLTLGIVVRQAAVPDDTEPANVHWGDAGGRLCCRC